MSTPARSTRVLLVGGAIAIAIGAAAALLRPPPPAPVPSHNVVLPVPADARPSDARALQERMLEELIQDSATAERVDRLAAFSTFVLLVSRDPEGFGWVLDRLLEPDVPASLRTAFAGHLPTRSPGAVQATIDRLLAPLLEGADPRAARAALDVLRARGLTATRSHGPCACAFGVYPADPTPGEPMWLFAFSRDDARGLRWSVQERSGPAGWHLGLAEEPGGPEVLVHRVDAAPPGPLQIQPSDDLSVPLELGQDP